MNLKQLLIENDLYKYIENYCTDNLNKMTFNSYEKIENGFILHTKTKDYRVITKIYDSFGADKNKHEYTYYAEQRKRNRLECFLKIPCNTQAEEKKYPKIVGWLGTALTERMNINLN
jgi:O-succinylbenzoate synthase